jgi:hypothetical protein
MSENEEEGLGKDRRFIFGTSNWGYDLLPKKLHRHLADSLRQPVFSFLTEPSVPGNRSFP